LSPDTREIMPTLSRNLRRNGMKPLSLKNRVIPVVVVGSWDWLRNPSGFFPCSLTGKK